MNYNLGFVDPMFFKLLLLILIIMKLELAPLVNPSASKVGRAAPAQWYVRWNHYRNEFVKHSLLNSTFNVFG